MSNGRFTGDPLRGQVMMYGGAPPPIEPVSPSPMSPFPVVIPNPVTADILIAQLRLEIAKQFESIRASIRELELKVEQGRGEDGDEIVRLRKRNAALRKELEASNRIIQKLEKQLESKEDR